MKITVDTNGNLETLEFELENLIVVGFAGKDIEKTMEHIKELEAEGIKCPKTVPVIYQCSKTTLTNDKNIEVIGNKTSGEVEYLVLIQNGEYYIGIGSDHTDRELEAVSIHKSKQVCNKPYCTTFWRYEDVKDHFDELELQSTQVIEGKVVQYQKGVTSDLLSLETIVKKVKEEVSVDNCLIYTGTVPLLDGFKFGEEFSCKLLDHKLNRTLNLSYSINVIEEH